MTLEWYDFLSSARGLKSATDVQRVTQECVPRYRRLLADILPVGKDARIYDAGCGPGLTLNILKVMGYSDLEGTDLSGAAVSIARELSLNATQADSIEDLASRPDGTFSRIFAVDLVEHLQKPDLIRFLSIARTKLHQDDGMLIMRCPNGDSPIVGRHLFNDVTHVWTYTGTALAGLLMMNGFTSATFLDETPSLLHGRGWFRAQISRLAATLVRGVIKAATTENIGIMAPSFWVVARVR